MILASTPYSIDGTLYGIDGTTASSGTTVKAINDRTGESTSVTTNSSGQYILDAASFTSGYSNRDVIVIFFTDSTGTYKAYWRTRINTTDGSETLPNLSLLNMKVSTVGSETAMIVGQKYYNENITAKTTTTVLIPPYNSNLYKNSSIVLTNRSAYTLTTKVWVSDKPSPGTPGGSDWGQLGSDIINTTGTSTAKQWIGKYNWTCVLATNGTAGNQDVDIGLTAST